MWLQSLRERLPVDSDVIGNARPIIRHMPLAWSRQRTLEAVSRSAFPHVRRAPLGVRLEGLHKSLQDSIERLPVPSRVSLGYALHIAVLAIVLLSAMAARSAGGPASYSIREPASFREPASLQPVSPPQEGRPAGLPSSSAASLAAVRWPAALGRALGSPIWETQTSAGSNSTPPEIARAAPERKSPLQYKVAPGDTLSGIADSHGISVETVMWANNLSDPNSLQIGEELVILPVTGILHTVTSGDNVNDLALIYDVAPETIAEFNGLADPNMLQLGEKLVIPGGKMTMAAAGSSSRASRPAPVATGSFRWPTGGSISQYFGEAGHSGLDLATGMGSPVYAADGGVVVTALKLGYGYGWHLVIDHGNGLQTLYAHLSAFYVDYGERVGKGEQIGAVGSTGLSTGPHLHFEVLKGGVRVNPLNYLP